MARREKRRTRDWSKLSDDRLLDVRMCDLGLSIEGTALEDRLALLHDELERAGLRFRPYAWLSTDWFTPDRAAGFAIPFFLAHRRLQRLEHKQMLEVEGGTHDACMRILRHEAAHALDNAYRLHTRERWREVFGPFSRPYLMSYTPDPASKRFVVNLPFWYAQSHPAEDWAETFAVWLQPSSHWRRAYAGWPALRKLEYVDALMATIASRPPPRSRRTEDEPLHRVRLTLRQYYARKRAHYAHETSPVLDRQLRRVFVQPSDERAAGSATAFLRSNRRLLVRHVAAITGQHTYLVDHLVGEMVKRTKTLRLRLRSMAFDTLIDAAVLVTSSTTQFMHGGHPKYQR